ncbi:MAG: class I SAM-dependent methyltransferase [Anaerolineaceae bacterium]|nr:class I SAM-dependent methyltransferase [Anaerolineaceae bacterium]
METLACGCGTPLLALLSEYTEGKAMRSLRHLTPRYIWNRILEKIYRSKNPDLPWLTPDANWILSTYLKPSDVGIEFGSGQSTIWFAQHIANLISVEHDRDWYARNKRIFKEKGISNVEYRLRERAEGADAENELPSYVQVVEEIAPESLDFALIDGIYRDLCAVAVSQKVKPGGVIIIDNVNHYLPNSSFSPNSRTYAQGPISELWGQFMGATEDWRCIWTTNGVSDTAFYFKP